MEVYSSDAIEGDRQFLAVRMPAVLLLLLRVEILSTTEEKFDIASHHF